VLERRVEPVVLEMLDTFRVVHLGGARQSGKTTLIRDLLPAAGGSSVTLDDEALLLRARDDAAGFVASLERPARIDEFQRAGEGLLLAVKAAADVDRRRGQFLLTGSAGSISVGRRVETLAGRVGRAVLWPLSQGEQRSSTEVFLDRLASPESWPPPGDGRDGVRDDVVAAVVQGGYPEVVTERMTSRARSRWFEAYASETIDREAVRSLVARTPGPELSDGRSDGVRSSGTRQPTGTRSTTRVSQGGAAMDRGQADRAIDRAPRRRCHADRGPTARPRPNR
jgi:uncharacterized protein